MYVGPRFRTKRVKRREKKYTHVHTIAYITRILQPALTPLTRGSALAFRKYHLLVTFRFNMFPPFVRDASSLRRAFRGLLPSLPKFVGGPTFERSSVKKSVMPLENYVPVHDVLSSFYYVLVCNRWVGWKSLHIARRDRDMLRELRCGG